METARRYTSTKLKPMLKIKRHSGIYTLEAQQEIPMSIDEAWSFFSSPANLEKITPPSMGFHITSDNLARTYTGQIITYTVSPIPGIRMNWVTEISSVNEPKVFVDEQRFGPYAMWHHEHHFEETENGVLMTDRVSYKMPFGILGHIAHALFVKRQLTEIFQYRIKALDKMFSA